MELAGRKEGNEEGQEGNRPERVDKLLDLTEMISTMELAEQKEEYDDGLENIGNKRECEACKGEGVKTKADGICVECDEDMCKTCFEHHLKAKQCRNHEFDTKCPKAMPPKRNFEVEKCKRHEGELIKIYCRTHNIVGCEECMIPDHFGCSQENIKDICEEFQCNEKLSSFEESVEELDFLAKENYTKIQEKRKANSKMIERELNRIRQFKKYLNNYLDTAETSFLHEAKEISDENVKCLTRLEEECKLQMSRLTEMSGELDPAIYSERGLFIQTATLNAITLDIQQALLRIKEENKITNFYFIPNRNLSKEFLGNFWKICYLPPRILQTETTKLQDKSPNENVDDKIHLSAVGKH